jgi:hypothetical protein
MNSLSCYFNITVQNLQSINIKSASSAIIQADNHSLNLFSQLTSSDINIISTSKSSQIIQVSSVNGISESLIKLFISHSGPLYFSKGSSFDSQTNFPIIVYGNGQDLSIPEDLKSVIIPFIVRKYYVRVGSSSSRSSESYSLSENLTEACSLDPEIALSKGMNFGSHSTKVQA